MSLTENSDQVFLPGGCNRTQNLRFGPYTIGGISQDDTNHLTQPHTIGSNTACWFIGKYGLSNANSEDPNEVPEFCGVSRLNNGASRIIIIYITKLMP